MTPPREVTPDLKLLGNLYFAIGLGMIALGFVITGIAINSKSEFAGFAVLLAIPLVVLGLPYWIVGWAIRAGKSWGLVAAVVAGTLALGTVVGVPLAVFTYMVAYQQWSVRAKARSEIKVLSSAPPKTKLDPSLQPYAKVLGAFYFLLALGPLYFASVVAGDIDRDIKYDGFFNISVFFTLGALAVTGLIVAIGFGIIRGARWAYIAAAIISLPLLRFPPAGTILAIATGYFAYRVLTAGRASPPQAPPQVQE